jgi:uncharacterized protein (DUF1800 family)
MATPVEYIQHLYKRFGFGISLEEAKALKSKKLGEIVSELFNASIVSTPLKAVAIDSIPKAKEAMAEGMNKKELNKLIHTYSESLNTDWIKQLGETKAVVREKQTLFWHNHFACRLRNPYLMQELNNVHRKFAFANFRELLFNVSKHAAMLQFLNNQQNKKEHPNENFARELMELFTLGRGHYTEQDVKESARAFTGWTFNRDTFEYEFREKQHDFDKKTFLKREGNFGGEDIINIIMDQRQTAYFLCKKMYAYYVNDVVDDKRVKELAEYYYANAYNTDMLLRKIALSDWFYAPQNIGNKIKAPVDFLVILNRQFGIQYESDSTLIVIQRSLGQLLFYPPNVAGWPGGKSWINSSTLMLRLRLPSMLLNSGVIDIETEDDDPDDGPMNISKSVYKNYKTTVNWESIVSRYKEASLEDMAKVLLGSEPEPELKTIIKTDTGSVKELVLKLVSLPHYQLY